MRPSRCRATAPTGFICAFFATFMGFALIWHIWWLVGLAASGAFATFVVFAWRDKVEDVIPAEEVARLDRANRSARSDALARAAGGAMSAFEGTPAGRPDRIGAGPAIASRGGACGPRPGRPSGSSSATASGSSCSATSSCSRPSSRPTRCWSMRPPAGPSGRELFDLPNVAIETACLLLSSFTCGLAHIGAQRRSDCWFYGAMAVTFVLGAVFLGLEIHEFAGMVARAPVRRAAPSSRPSLRWSAATACT